jgi:hypothetical protein
MALNDLDGVGEGQGVDVAVAGQSGLMHQVGQGEMGQGEAVEFLPDQLDRAAAQGAAPAGAP